VERLGINPTLPVEQILDQLATLDPIQFQDLGYMFEEFVRAPMPFKVFLTLLYLSSTNTSFNIPGLAGPRGE
jgi:hypothetical protein